MVQFSGFAACDPSKQNGPRLQGSAGTGVGVGVGDCPAAKLSLLNQIKSIITNADYTLCTFKIQSTVNGAWHLAAVNYKN